MDEANYGHSKLQWPESALSNQVSSDGAIIMLLLDSRATFAILKHGRRIVE